MPFLVSVSNHQVSSLNVSSISSPRLPNRVHVLRMILLLPSPVSRFSRCLSYNYTFSKFTDSFLAGLASQSSIRFHSWNLQLFIWSFAFLMPQLSSILFLLSKSFPWFYFEGSTIVSYPLQFHQVPDPLTLLVAPLVILLVWRVFHFAFHCPYHTIHLRFAFFLTTIPGPSFPQNFSHIRLAFL